MGRESGGGGGGRGDTDLIFMSFVRGIRVFLVLFLWPVQLTVNKCEMELITSIKVPCVVT